MCSNGEKNTPGTANSRRRRKKAIIASSNKLLLAVQAQKPHGQAACTSSFHSLAPSSINLPPIASNSVARS